jgi:hypothetical protein
LSISRDPFGHVVGGNRRNNKLPWLVPVAVLIASVMAVLAFTLPHREPAGKWKNPPVVASSAQIAAAKNLRIANLNRFANPVQKLNRLAQWQCLLDAVGYTVVPAFPGWVNAKEVALNTVYNRIQGNPPDGGSAWRYKGAGQGLSEQEDKFCPGKHPMG